MLHTRDMGGSPLLRFTFSQNATLAEFYSPFSKANLDKSGLAAVDEQLPLWDNLRGGIMTPSNDIAQPDPQVITWAKAKEAAYHIRKNLAIAATAGGYYIPENETDSNLLQQVLIRSGRELGYVSWEAQVAQSVKELDVPSLEGLPLSEIVAVREQSDAFNEFRLWLSRNLLAPSPEHQQALIEITSHEIEAEIIKLRSKLSDSHVIRKFIRENGLKIATQTLIGMAISSTITNPILGAATGALSGMVSSMFERDQRSGILARLARINRTAPDAISGEDGLFLNMPRPLTMPFLGEMRLGPANIQPYTTKRLRVIVERAMKPNTTGNPHRAISDK